MNFNLDGEARVWIYQSSRFLADEEVFRLRTRLKEFLSSWTSHGAQLWADARVLHDLFLVLAVDESKAKASGCSIDSSVHFVQAVGKHLDVDFFGRQTFAYKKNREGDIALIASSALTEAYRQGRIDDDTLFFDNLVNTVGDFNNNWLKPLANSWHYRFVRNQ